MKYASHSLCSPQHNSSREYCSRFKPMPLSACSVSEAFDSMIYRKASPLKSVGSAIKSRFAHVVILIEVALGAIAKSNKQ